jgi:hypothetical protein
MAEGRQEMKYYCIRQFLKKCEKKSECMYASWKIVLLNQHITSLVITDFTDYILHKWQLSFETFDCSANAVIWLVK